MGRPVDAYLLDTSALLWTVVDSFRLSKAAKAAITNGPLVASVVSYWEIVIKVRKGQLDIADPILWWESALPRIGAAPLSIRANHVAAVSPLPPIHKDPFDRMLIAQCAAEGLVLVTSDEQIRRYPIKSLW